jgi:Mat/Ecp fimbriae outer membrane usher protein
MAALALGWTEGAAGQAPVPLVQVAEPAGFSRLTGPQHAVVDVFFGGRRLGNVEIRHRPGEVSFLAPDSVLELLPEIVDPVLVSGALAKPLVANSNLVCAETADVAGCGTLRPETVGVIFDQDRFRLDLFINPRLLAVRPARERTYLQPPDDDRPSFLASLDAVISGSEQGQTVYNVQNNLLVAWGEGRLRAELAVASGLGLQSERLSLEIDRPGWRYSAGSFWTPGTAALARRKIIGLGIQSQIDTRVDKDVVRGTPLVVFLSQRARVDILLDGRVVASRIYDAGNQTLDTSGLPDGTYQIVLRIEELGGNRREESRLFTRNPRIPATGQDVLFAYAGALVDDRASSFLDVTGRPFMQAGAARRISSSVALDATIMATDRAAVGELGGYLITNAGILRLALLAHSRGQYGGLLQLSSNGNTPFNFHFDLRRIVVDADVPMFSSEHPSDLGLGQRSYTQAQGSVSYSLPNTQILLAGSLRDEDGIGRSYAFGPAIRWNFLSRGDWRLFLNGDAAVTERGTTGYIGFNVQLNRSDLAFGARGGARLSNSDGGFSRLGFVGAIDGSIQRDVLGGKLGVGVGVEHENDRDVLSGAANLQTRAASVNFDVLRSFGGQTSQIQYSVGVHTMLLSAGDSLALEGRERSESMVVVKVDGARTGDRFEILIDDARVSSIAADGGKVVIPVPAYREFDVRIRPESGGLVQYDSSARRVSVYPGTVATLEWEARSVVPVFGRIRLAEGEQFAGATILTVGGPGDVDDSGFFQIEASVGGQANVRLADGRSCLLNLPQFTSREAFVSVGEVQCNPEMGAGSLRIAGVPQK